MKPAQWWSSDLSRWTCVSKSFICSAKYSETSWSHVPSVQIYRDDITAVVIETKGCVYWLSASLCASPYLWFSVWASVRRLWASAVCCVCRYAPFHLPTVKPRKDFTIIKVSTCHKIMYFVMHRYYLFFCLSLHILTTPKQSKIHIHFRTNARYSPQHSNHIAFN